MFERFTEKARNVIVVAGDLAADRDVGIKDLFAALFVIEEGVAARVLKDLGVRKELAFAHAGIGLGDQPAARSGSIPFTPEANEALSNSLREALSLGHNYVGTEHLLFGLLRYHEISEEESALRQAGVSVEDVRSAVLKLLSTPPPAKSFEQHTAQARRRGVRDRGVIAPPELVEWTKSLEDEATAWLNSVSKATDLLDQDTIPLMALNESLREIETASKRFADELGTLTFRRPR